VSASGEIFMNYTGVNNTIEDMESANIAIMNILETLEDEIQPLRATWSGPSEQEYEICQAKWVADMTDMFRMLGQAGDTLQQMALNTSSTDAGTADGWASVGSGL